MWTKVKLFFKKIYNVIISIIVFLFWKMMIPFIWFGYFCTEIVDPKVNISPQTIEDENSKKVNFCVEKLGMDRKKAAKLITVLRVIRNIFIFSFLNFAVLVISLSFLMYFKII